MKPKTLLLAATLSCIFLNHHATAQVSVEEAMARKHPDCKDVFLNAIDIIPQLYKEKSFDSLQKAIDIWKSTCGSLLEVRYTEILLAIERSSFNTVAPDSGLVELLQSYSFAYKNYSRYNTYFGTTSSFYKLSSTWARLLLERANLSVNEKFVCNVFAGNISNPEKEIKQHKDEYKLLFNLLNKNFADQKKRGSTEYTIISGIWSPTGNASLLGVHPSIGLQLGGRFDRHQIDLTMQVRFLKSANTYTVKRNNSLYDLDHYIGGYIGLDYNYYFVNKMKYDLGIIAGAGYDGFDIANSGDDNENDYLKPLTISSLNMNTGLRFNYAFNPAFYLGLQGKYNFINYGTNGGTSLNGDAFSFDLIIGFASRPQTMRRNYWY
jgi:hypothetical protein